MERDGRTDDNAVNRTVTINNAVARLGIGDAQARQDIIQRGQSYTRDEAYMEGVTRDLKSQQMQRQRIEDTWHPRGRNGSGKQVLSKRQNTFKYLDWLKWRGW